MKYYLLLLLIFFSCSEERSHRLENLKQWKEDNGKIKVLSTTAMIHDLITQVGNGYVDSIPLISGELDPHSYQLVKGDDEKLQIADLIFYNGLGLEHGGSLQAYLKSSQKAIPLGTKIKEKFPEKIIMVNNEFDPHIWMDISLFSHSIPIIVEALSNKDPEHKKVYEENGKALMQEMLKKHQDLRNIVQTIPKERRYLISSHDAFNYFTRAYLATEEEQQNGLWENRFKAPEGLAPDSQISSHNIMDLLEYIQKYHVHILFTETNVSKDSIRKILEAGKARDLHLKIAETPLYGDAMGGPYSDGDSYLKMMEHNAKALLKNL